MSYQVFFSAVFLKRTRSFLPVVVFSSLNYVSLVFCRFFLKFAQLQTETVRGRVKAQYAAAK